MSSKSRFTSNVPGESGRDKPKAPTASFRTSDRLLFLADLAATLTGKEDRADFMESAVESAALAAIRATGIDPELAWANRKAA